MRNPENERLEDAHCATDKHQKRSENRKLYRRENKRGAPQKDFKGDIMGQETRSVFSRTQEFQ